MHNRETIYRQLWKHTGRQGELLLSQQEMAKALYLPYQRLSVVYHEFIDTGRMRKMGHTFQIFNPDSFEWGETYAKERKLISDD